MPLNGLIALIIAVESIAVKMIMNYLQKRKDAKMNVMPTLDTSQTPSSRELALYYVPLVFGTA
jgi:hypothetical protein